APRAATAPEVAPGSLGRWSGRLGHRAAAGPATSPGDRVADGGGAGRGHDRAGVHAPTGWVGGGVAGRSPTGEDRAALVRLSVRKESVSQQGPNPSPHLTGAVGWRNAPL